MPLDLRDDVETGVGHLQLAPCVGCVRGYGPGPAWDRVPASVVTDPVPDRDQPGGGAPPGIGYRLPRCHGDPATSGLRGGNPGGVPERPKGADCKSVGYAYPGSNPGAATLEGTPSELRKRSTEGVSLHSNTQIRTMVEKGGLSHLVSGASRT
ncbi:protein of unknown function [Streptantibioticus cattleyicolor NRRL 8057 = DSM 46488]|nr:protein of unknown function [Streptantibioticus cattleyicolor NRRL 8057 = DSM 46488]